MKESLQLNYLIIGIAARRCAVQKFPQSHRSLTCVRTSLATPLVVFTAELVVDETTLKVTVCMAAGKSLSTWREAEQEAML